MRAFTSILFLFFFVCCSAPPAWAEESDQATDAVMKRCAGGQVWHIDGEVSAGLRKFFKTAAAEGKGNIGNLGAIIDKLKPDSVGVEFYRLYTQCISDQAAKELQRLGIASGQKLDEIKSIVSRRPIDWPKGTFSANMMLKRITLSRSYDTVVGLYDADCPIYVWLPAWEWPPDRTNYPVLKIAPTNSAQIAHKYPFKITLTRDGAEVNDAGWATRDLPDYEFGGLVGRQKFNEYAISKPDEIVVYLALRTLQENCGGSMSIDQVSRKAE